MKWLRLALGAAFVAGFLGEQSVWSDEAGAGKPPAAGARLILSTPVAPAASGVRLSSKSKSAVPPSAGAVQGIPQLPGSANLRLSSRPTASLDNVDADVARAVETLKQKAVDSAPAQAVGQGLQEAETTAARFSAEVAPFVPLGLPVRGVDRTAQERPNDEPRANGEQVDATRQMPESTDVEPGRPEEMPLGGEAGEASSEPTSATATAPSSAEQDAEASANQSSSGESLPVETATSALTPPPLTPNVASSVEAAESSEPLSASSVGASSESQFAAEPRRSTAESGTSVDSDARLRHVLKVIGFKHRSAPTPAGFTRQAPRHDADSPIGRESGVAPVSHRQSLEAPRSQSIATQALAEVDERPAVEADSPSAGSLGAGALIESVVEGPVPSEPRTTLKRPVATTRLQDDRMADPTPVADGRLNDLRVAQAPQPGLAEAPGAKGADPFEVIDQTGELSVTMRRSKLLKLKLDVFRIAIVDPNVCDVIQYTPHELSIVGKTVGATHVTFWFDDGNQRPVTYLVTVEPDVRVRQQIDEDYRKLEALIAELFPDSLVRLVPMADKLIVKGQAKDAEEAAQILSLLRNQGGGGGGGGGMGGFGMSLAGGTATSLYSPEETGGVARPRIQIVNMLRVPGVHQIALRVKIAELNRTAARDFGVGIGGTINMSSNPQGSALFIQSMLGLASGGAAGGGAAAPTFLAQFDGDDIRVGIRYMQKAGVLRLLSEPTLVTLSGQQATFVAGGEFAVPTLVGSVGLNAVTTDFRSFGAIISFMPTVVDKDRIRLQVAPEFSQINSGLTNGQTGTPGLNVRAVTTTVEMREGQTFAIAGLLEDTMKSGTGSDIPFLHKLFGAREVSRTETELIILVTPELVHPMDPEEVPPLPGFDVTEPSNYQFYLKGEIEGTPTRDWRSPVWPRLRQRYNAGGSSMISGPFGHGQ